MRNKLFKILNKIYGILMLVSFFAGLLPLVPFVIAIIIGGDKAEKISVFLYDKYYPPVIVLGSVAIVLGLIAMYIGKIDGLSVKNISAKK